MVEKHATGPMGISRRMEDSDTGAKLRMLCSVHSPFSDVRLR
jgi:hypothetical protein